MWGYPRAHNHETRGKLSEPHRKQPVACQNLAVPLALKGARHIQRYWCEKSVKKELLERMKTRSSPELAATSVVKSTATAFIRFAELHIGAVDKNLEHTSLTHLSCP